MKEEMKLPPLPAGYINPGMSPVYSASMMMAYAEQAVREALAEQPAQQEPVAMSFDDAWGSLRWAEWRMRPPKELFAELHRLTSPQPAQQEPVLELLKQSRANFEHNFGICGKGWADWIYGDLAQLLADTTPQPPAQQQEYWEEQPDGSVIPVDPSEMQPAPVQQEQSNKSLWMDCTALADAIHYPDCWDTGAYPELDDALHELAAWFKVFGCTTCAEHSAQRKPMPRILDVWDIGQASLQIVFKNRSDANEYKNAIEEQP